MYKKLIIVLFLAYGFASAASAANTFQNSCSNVEFAYANGTQATLKAVCLQADGRAVPASLELKGISNENGKLTHSSGDASSFQQSCGSIQILVDGPDVTLAAICRNNRGEGIETSLPLRNIGNDNGRLVQ